jgi:hypothetical protein
MKEQGCDIPPIMTSRPDDMDREVYKKLMKLQNIRIKMQLRGQPCANTIQEKKESQEDLSFTKNSTKQLSLDSTMSRKKDFYTTKTKVKGALRKLSRSLNISGK